MTCEALLYLTMANGSFHDPRIVACDSGMRRVLMYNVYSKDTRIGVCIA